MAVTTAIAVAGLGLAAVGSAVSFVQGRKRADAAKKARKSQERRQRLETQRQRRRQIRESRIRRGQALNQAVQVGAGRSSAIEGGLSGLSSQRGSNLGYIGQTMNIAEDTLSAQQEAADAASLQSFGSGLSDLGFGIFSSSDKIGDMFS